MIDPDRFTRIAGMLSAAGITTHLDHPLGSMTTYGVGGAARVAVVVEDHDACVVIGSIMSHHRDVPVAVLGRGSNTLVADTGFDGVAVIMRAEAGDGGVDVDPAGRFVIAHGAASMPVLARRSVAAGLGGLEWCVGIPGSVGGAVRMNAGGHGAEMADSLESATVVSLRSGGSTEVAVDRLGLHFRGSALSGHHVVLSARLRTSVRDAVEGQRILDEVVAWRRRHQPGGRNAGSVFVNPAPGEGSAGALIDAAGLRGHRAGGAAVSDKHANFIQADQGAMAADVVAVMEQVQDAVERVHGVRLRSEVCLLGFDADVQQRFADPSHDDAVKVAARQALVNELGENR